MMKFSKGGTPTRKHTTRKIVLISLAAATLLAVAIYGIMSYREWDAASLRSLEARTWLKTTTDEKLGAQDAPTSVADTITSLLDDFAKSYGLTPCELPAAYHWQAALPMLRERHNECNASTDATLALVAALATYRDYMNDQKAAALLLNSAQDATANQIDFEAAATLWSEATTPSALPPSYEFASTRDKIIDAGTSITAAYLALAAANKAEDKTAFDVAEIALKDAYVKLDTITQTAKTQQTALSEAVVTAYSKL